MPDTVASPEIVASACPHDCPSTCALEVERLDPFTIGRVRGSPENAYTEGVICAKVARYAERIHHPDRLTKSYQRIGPKSSGEFREISFEAALDETAEALLRAEARHGSETVWPYFYAGTMGQVQRDFDPPAAPRKEVQRPALNHLRHQCLERHYRRHRLLARRRPQGNARRRHGGDMGHQRR